MAPCRRCSTQPPLRPGQLLKPDPAPPTPPRPSGTLPLTPPYCPPHFSLLPRHLSPVFAFVRTTHQLAQPRFRFAGTCRRKHFEFSQKLQLFASRRSDIGTVSRLVRRPINLTACLVKLITRDRAAGRSSGCSFTVREPKMDKNIFI